MPELPLVRPDALREGVGELLDALCAGDEDLRGGATALALRTGNRLLPSIEARLRSTLFSSDRLLFVLFLLRTVSDDLLGVRALRSVSFDRRSG